MQKSKKSIYRKVTAILVLFSFVSFDISRADIDLGMGSKDTLATQSLHQENMMTSMTERYRDLALSDGKVLGSVLTVSDYLYRDGQSFNYLDSVVASELGNMAEGLEINKVVPYRFLQEVMSEDYDRKSLESKFPKKISPEDVIVIPFRRGSRMRLIFVAPRKEVSARKVLSELPGEEWKVGGRPVSPRYIIKDLLWDKSSRRVIAPVSGPALTEVGRDRDPTVDIAQTDAETIEKQGAPTERSTSQDYSSRLTGSPAEFRTKFNEQTSMKVFEDKIAELLREHGEGGVIKVAFDRGKGKSPEFFDINFPNIDLRKPDNMNLVTDHIIYQLYNRAGIYGAHKIMVNVPEKTNAEFRIFKKIIEKFNAPVNDDPQKGYHLIGNYFNLVYGLVGGAQFRLEEASIDDIEKLKTRTFQRSSAANPKFGNIIGVDIGKSDVKAIASRSGDVVSSTRFDWSPQDITDSKEHLENIRRAIKNVKNEANFKKIDAIGISINLAVHDNKPTGLGPVVNGIAPGGAYSEKRFKKEIQGMSEIFGKEFGVPVYVLNDGDAAAVQVSIDMNMPNTLALSLGSGLAGGYVDNALQVKDWLTEMGNVIIDTDPDAVGHSFSKVKGASQQYLSQRSVFRLAESLDLQLEGKEEADKLRYAQRLFVHGTPEQKEKLKKIFTEIANYVAVYALVTHNILGQDNVVLFGRVTEGESGKLMLETARKIVEESGVNVNIIFPDNTGFTEEKASLIQTHGQAIGASYYASQRLTEKSFRPEISSHDITAFLNELVGQGDALRTREVLRQEAFDTGRPINSILTGIVGREKLRDEQWRMEVAPRGPPSDIMYIGGGGEGITTFVQAIVNSARRDLTYEEYANLTNRTISAINDGVYDDGGDTAFVRIDIHDSDSWPDEVTTLCGDVMSLISYATGSEAKIYFLDDSFRMNAIINVNKADLDTLQVITDKETAQKIIDSRDKYGNFSKPEENDDAADKRLRELMGEELYKRVGKNLRFGEEHSETSVLKFVKDRLKETQELIDKNIMERPEDWMFFAANMLSLAMIIDEHLVKTRDLKLIGTKWQNLMDLAIKIDVGQINRGSEVINFQKNIWKLYEVLGISASFALSPSKDDATMQAILEAVTVKINDEKAFLVGPADAGKKDIPIRRIDMENAILGDIMAVPLYVEGPQTPTSKLSSGASLIETLTCGQKMKLENDGGNLVITIGDDNILLSEKAKDEGMTVVALKGKEQPLRFDARWNMIDVGGVEIGIKTRSVIEQTYVTDEVSSSRVNKVVFKRAKRDSEGKYIYATDGVGNVKLDDGGRKLREFEFIPTGKKPKLDTDTREAIQAVRKAFVYGEGGMITSLLPNFLVEGTISEVYERITRDGLRGVFYPKLTEDLETRGLSISEQMEVLDRSIKSEVGGNLGFSDIVTDIILPVIPEDVRTRAQHFFELEQKEFYSEKMQEDLKSRKYKLSKKFPSGVIEISTEDEAYFKGRGIRIHYFSNFDFNSKNKLVWDKKELYKLIETISSRNALVNMVQDEKEKETLVYEWYSTKEDPFSGSFFWPISDWHTIYKTISGDQKVCKEKISVVINENRSDESVFHLELPWHEELSDRQKEMTIQYLTNFVYNRLVMLGGVSLTFYGNREIYEGVERNFLDNTYGLMRKFNELYYGEDFSITHIPTPKEGDGSMVGLKPRDSNIDLGSIDDRVYLGISLSDEMISISLIENKKVVQTTTGQFRWTPENISDGAEYVRIITEKINSMHNVRIEEVAGIGISWPSAISGNTIIGRAGKIVKGFSNLSDEQFKEKLGDLAGNLQQTLGTPVIITNNGKAIAFKKIMESKEEFKNTLFLGIDEGVSASYVDENGDILAAMGEVGNLVIDMNIDAPSHSFTRVRGAMQQFLSRRGIVRLAESLLMGDLMPGDVNSCLGKIYQEVAESVVVKDPFKVMNSREDLSRDDILLRNAMIEMISNKFAKSIQDFSDLYPNMYTVLLPSEIQALSLEKKGEVGSAGELQRDALTEIVDRTNKIIREKHDCRRRVMLRDDLSPRYIVEQWRDINDSQTREIFDKMAYFLAESVAEISSYMTGMKKVVIHGEMIPWDIGEHLSQKANELLSDKYKLDVVVSTVDQRTDNERRFLCASGAGYAAAVRLHKAIEEDVPDKRSSVREEDPEMAKFFSALEVIMNSRRARMERAAEEVVGFLNERFFREDSRLIKGVVEGVTIYELCEDIDRILKDLEELRRFYQGSIGEVPAFDRSLIEAESFLRENFEQLQVDSVISSIVILARQAARSGQHLIVGLETDWIPGVKNMDSLQRQAINPLITQISRIDSVLRSMGLKNVIVVNSSGNELAADIKLKARKSNTDYANIVVLASKETVSSPDFDELRSTEHEEKAFFAEVDSTKIAEFYETNGEKLDEQLRINILEMLSITLELAAGKHAPDTPLIIEYSASARRVVFLPQVERIDFETLKQYYSAIRTALMSA